MIHPTDGTMSESPNRISSCGYILEGKKSCVSRTAAVFNMSAHHLILLSPKQIGCPRGSLAPARSAHRKNTENVRVRLSRYRGLQAALCK